MNKFVIFALTILSFWNVVHGDEIPDLEYLLWTPQNPNKFEYDTMKKNSSWVRSSHFMPDRPSKVLCHGFTSDPMDGFVMQMREEFLIHGSLIFFFKWFICIIYASGNYNIISADYEELVSGPLSNYPAAVNNSHLIGAAVADFLQFLVAEFPETTLDSFHPIGFSLGGQVVGSIGEHLNGVLPRISALDPAGMGFYEGEFENKLSPDDAQFVDVIYTTGYWVGTMQVVNSCLYIPYILSLNHKCWCLIR